MITNAETGEPAADPYRDVVDHVQPPAREAPPAEPKKNAATSDTPPLKPGWPVLDTLEKIEQFRSELKADVYHPALSDPELMDYFATAQWRLDGKGDGEPEVIGELFEGGRLRPPGADALSPAPRPELPEGHAFDEGALVLAETEAHAMNMPPHLVMTVTDELAGMVEQEEQRGAGWGYEDGMAELTRRFGSEGAPRVAANAQWALEALAQSEHALIRQRVAELAEGRPNDPNLIAMLGNTIYEAIRNAPPSERLAALLGRREHRLGQVDAAAHARRGKARQAEEAEADAVGDEALDQLGAQHRRWQSRP